MSHPILPNLQTIYIRNWCHIGINKRLICFHSDKLSRHIYTRYSLQLGFYNNSYLFCQEFVTPLSEETKNALLIRLLSQGRGCFDFAQNIVAQIGNPAPVPQPRATRLPWCICGVCVHRDNEEENKCCKKVTCVTSYQAFHNQCIDQLSLTLAIRQRCDMRADAPDYSMNSYRKAAYRTYILWKYGKLGRGNRRVVPSCVVRTVRRAYPAPDNEYMGFRAR